MRALIESLLILARQDSDGGNLCRGPCALDQIAAEAVRLLRSVAAERRITVSLDTRPVPIDGDLQQLRQVVINLISNAVEYNQPGGKVKVSVRRENRAAVIIVEDNGQGIAPEDLSTFSSVFIERTNPARSRMATLVWAWQFASQ